jgi:hypothetical protein
MPAAGAAPNDAVRSARRSGAGIWDARVAAAGVSGLARSELTGASNAAGVQALAWVEPVGGVPQVQLRVRAAGAAVWTAPALPVQTSASLAGGSPALAIDSQGRVAIVWRQLVNGVGELRSRTLDAATLVYSSELPVDSGQPDMRNPRLIAYGDNKFLVTWEQLAGTVYELRSKTGTQAAWLAGARRIDSRVESVSAALVLRFGSRPASFSPAAGPARPVTGRCRYRCPAAVARLICGPAAMRTAARSWCGVSRTRRPAMTSSMRWPVVRCRPCRRSRCSRWPMAASAHRRSQSVRVVPRR